MHRKAYDMSTPSRVSCAACAFASFLVLSAMSAARADSFGWTGPCTANTPNTAYAWNDANNWTNSAGVAEVPASRGKVVFPPLSGAVYVQLPDEDVVIGSASFSDNNLYLVGEHVFTYSSGTFGSGYGPWMFTDVCNGLSDGGIVYTAHVNFAGRVTDQQKLISSWQDTDFRLDRFAQSSNPLRTDDFVVVNVVHPGSGSNNFYGPESSATNMTSAWTLAEGSPYISRASNCPHAIPVGTLVTGAGLPEGTFVKRYFTKTQLELSAPATASGSDVALTFAAFTPDVRIHFANFHRQGFTTVHNYLFKYRAEDTLRFEFDSYNIYDGSKGQNNQLGNPLGSSYQPGTYVLHAVNNSDGLVTLLNAHLEFAGTSGGGPTTLGDKVVARMGDSSDYTARLTVTNNLVGDISCFSNWVGSVVKDGAGLLKLGLASAQNTGSLAIEAGTVQLAGRGGTAGDFALGKLTLGAEGTLSLPAGVRLTVSEISVAAGAKLNGPGTLRVQGASSDLAGIALENGAKVEYAYTGNNVFLGVPEPEVVGHPAFWVDASKPESIVYTTELGTNYVTRWNDCRAGEPMFCTNLIRRPIFVNGAGMKDKYVKIRAVPDALYITNTETLVWSEPIRDVRAVFLVQDATDGGGQILGRCSWRLSDANYGSRGGPFYRDSIHNWASVLVAGGYATDPVLHGTFYLNGEQVVGNKHGWLGAFMQLLEFHSNTNYWANKSNKVRGIACDNFGISYTDVHDSTGWVGAHNGRMRIAECIIYTNTLTFVERARVAQHLTQKWLGKDVIVQDAAAGPASLGGVDASVDVGVGDSAAVTEISGSGSVAKTGGGLLYVRGARDARLSVEGGEAVVRSFGFDKSTELSVLTKDVPWLHLDANNTNDFTLRTVNGTNFVSRWKSETTNGYYAAALPGQGGVKDSWIVTDPVSGRRMVDTGPVGSSNALMLYDPRPGYSTDLWPGATNASQERNGSTSPDVVRTAFIAYSTLRDDGERYGGALLGSYYGSHPSYGFPCYQGEFDQTTRCMIGHTTHNWGWTDMKSAYDNGTIDFALNGTRFSPFATVWQPGTDVFSFNGRYVTTRRTVTLAAQDYGSGSGGLKYGEVILSSNYYDTVTVSNIENYLRAKWRGERIPGFGAATFDSLAVSGGATVRVLGSGGVTASSLSGAGTIVGDVTLAENAVFVVPVSDNGTSLGSALTIDGALVLPAQATVQIVGDDAALVPDCYSVLSCASITADMSLAGWTVLPPAKSHLRYLIRVVDGGLAVNAAPSGTLLLFR